MWHGGGSRLEKELNNNRVGKELLTTRQGPNDAFGGRVRKIGYDKRGVVSVRKRDKNLKGFERTRTSVKQSVGAATLLGNEKQG